MDSGKINNGRNPVWDELLSSGRGRPTVPAAPAAVEIPFVLPKSGLVVTLSSLQGVMPIVPNLPDLTLAAPPRDRSPATPNPAQTPAPDAQLLARALAAGAHPAPLTPPRPPGAPRVPEPATPRGPALPRELAPLLARREALAPALTSATARAAGLASVLAQALAAEPALVPGRTPSPAPAPGFPPAHAPVPGLPTSPALTPAFLPGHAPAPAATPAPAPAPLARRSERSADDALPNFAAAPARTETPAPGSPVAPSHPAAPAEVPLRMDTPVSGQIPLFSPASPGVTKTAVNTPDESRDLAALAPRPSPEVMAHLLPRPQLPAAVPYLNRLIVGTVVLAVVLLLVF